MANFFNPTGGTPVVSYGDDGRRAAAAQDAAIAAMIAQQKADRDQEVLTRGTFADRANQAERMARLGFVHDAEMGRQTGDYGIQGLNIQNQPALGRLDLDKTKYGDAWKAGESTRALTDAENALELNLIPKVGGAPAPNPMGAVFKDMGTNALVGGAYQSNGAAPVVAPAASGNALVGNSGGMPTSGGQPTQDMSQYLAFRRAKMGQGPIESPDTVFNRQIMQKIVETAAANLSSEDPEVQAQAVKTLKSAGMKVPDGVLPTPTPALARQMADKKTMAYISSPTIQGRVQQLLPGLIESAKQNPEGIAYALQQSANALSVEAGREGADPVLVGQALRKTLATQLAPELEKLRPGNGKRLLAKVVGAGLLGPIAGPLAEQAAGYTGPQAADVLREGNF